MGKKMEDDLDQWSSSEVKWTTESPWASIFSSVTKGQYNTPKVQKFLWCSKIIINAWENLISYKLSKKVTFINVAVESRKYGIIKVGYDLIMQKNPINKKP